MKKATLDLGLPYQEDSLGVAFGSVFDNIGLGISLGISFGAGIAIVFWSIMQKINDKKDNS